MIQEFLDYQATNKGLSIESIEGYAKELRAFVHWAQPNGLRWTTITATDMDAYVSSEHERGMKPRTIRKRVECVRLLYTWANHRGLLDTNPARFTQVPKQARELPKAADIENLERYLAQPATSRKSMLIHVVVALILDTGMRISEVTKLKGEDINTENHTIAVTGKGSNERLVIYGLRSENYCRMMAHKKGEIFSHTPEAIRWMMYSELPGVNPHSIRHAFAMNQLNKGMNISSLSVLMGHKHTSTTDIYARATLESCKREYNN